MRGFVNSYRTLTGSKAPAGTSPNGPYVNFVPCFWGDSGSPFPPGMMVYSGIFAVPNLTSVFCFDVTYDEGQ